MIDTRPPAFDGPRYAAAYAACRGRVRALLTGLTAAQEAATVPACPDWSVADLTAHLAGVCRALVEGNPPGPDVQAWVDGQVEDRRQRGVVANLDEWDEFGTRFERLIVERGPSLGGLLYDIVAHEHDAAAALGRPADRDNDGVVLSLDTLAFIIRRDAARHGLAAIRFGDGVRTWYVGDGEPGFTLELPAWELMRWLGSRRSLRQMQATPHDGDLARFLPALAHLPLPVTDLVE